MKNFKISKQRKNVIKLIGGFQRVSKNMLDAYNVKRPDEVYYILNQLYGSFVDDEIKRQNTLRGKKSAKTGVKTRQLTNELKEFTKRLKDLPEPIKTLPKLKPYKYETSVRRKFEDWKKVFHYRLRLHQKEIDTADGKKHTYLDVDPVKDLTDLFNQKFYKSLPKDADINITVLYNVINKEFDDRTGQEVIEIIDTKAFQSGFRGSTEEALKKIKTILKNKQQEYDNKEDQGIHSRFTSIVVEVLYPNPLSTIGAGSVGKSIKTANKKWKVVSAKTRTNCLYTAVCLARRPQEYKELIENQDRLNNMSKQLKKKLKMKHPDIKTIVSDDKEISYLVEHIGQGIKLYNNCFRLIKEYQPTKRIKKEDLEIQIKNGHFQSMLRLKDISEEAPCDTQEGREELTLNNEDKIIEKKRKAFGRDERYCAYDIEATPDENGFHKAYACGFSWNSPKGIKHKQWFGMDCQLKFVSFLAKNIKYFKGATIYAHNGGKYDYPNIFREVLLKEDCPLKVMTNKCLELNGRLISFALTDGDNELTFRDSLCIFAGQSLDDLTKALDVEHKKLKETVKHNEINLTNYMTFPQLPQYLENDCTGLLECILKFADTTYKACGINLSQVFTGATLSKKYFYNNYYNQSKYPIYTLTKDKDSFIRDECYYGGRNECFVKKYVKGKVYYYDFTSLYPSTGCNDLPYGKPEWVELDSVKDFKNFFGFCEVKIRTRDFHAKPIHACIINNRLEFRHFKHWYKIKLFSEEIRQGMKYGVYEYDFSGCKGIKFQQAPIMRKFFQDCFDRKAAANDNEALRQTYKIIANSGYGFWGLRTSNRDSVVIVPMGSPDFYQYLSQGKLINYRDEGDYCIMRVEKDLEIEDFNVSIAAAISSYARMRLWQLITEVERKEGCKVYYCDTDSIITNCDLSKYPDLMSEFCWDKTGEDLGSLKNEAEDKLKKKIKKTLKPQTTEDFITNNLENVKVKGEKYRKLLEKCLEVDDEYSKLHWKKWGTDETILKLQRVVTSNGVYFNQDMYEERLNSLTNDEERARVIKINEQYNKLKTIKEQYTNRKNKYKVWGYMLDIHENKSTPKQNYNEVEQFIKSLYEAKIQELIKEKCYDGHVHFDELIVAGCKFYALKMNLPNGDKIEVCKLKGYREKDKPLKFDDYCKLMSGDISHIEQQQTQFNIPKSAMVDEDRNFGLKTLQVRKTFKPTYCKGEVLDNGDIVPFVSC